MGSTVINRGASDETVKAEAYPTATVPKIQHIDNNNDKTIILRVKDNERLAAVQNTTRKLILGLFTEKVMKVKETIPPTALLHLFV